MRGIAVLGGYVFAWRDNAGGTACDIHRSSPTGWTPVTLFKELAFTAGSGTAPAEGSTITKSGVTATVKRVCYRRAHGLLALLLADSLWMRCLAALSPLAHSLLAWLPRAQVLKLRSRCFQAGAWTMRFTTSPDWPGTSEFMALTG